MVAELNLGLGGLGLDGLSWVWRRTDVVQKCRTDVVQCRTDVVQCRTDVVQPEKCRTDVVQMSYRACH